MNYTQEVYSDYKIKRENNTLSVRLLAPTASGLQEECICVCKERKLPKNDKLLRSFFGPLENEEDYLQVITNYDVDKFRPLVNFLKGKTSKTNIKNIDLLAWLICDEKKVDSIIIPVEVNVLDLTGTGSLADIKPDNREPKTRQQIKPMQYFFLRHLNKICIIFLLIAIGTFMVWKNQKDRRTITEDERCMYWTGEHFEGISCEEQTDIIKISLDTKKLNSFKKITNYDQLTKKDLGKVWYSNIDKKIAFFTDSGMDPIDTNKKLKPLTPYILNKYVSYHRHLLATVIWCIGIGLSITAIFYCTIYFLKKKARNS